MAHRRAERRPRAALSSLALVLALLVVPAQARAQETAEYRLDVHIDWSAASHPYDFPPNAHFSGLIGAAHNGGYTLFADGRTASPGLEEIAETGGRSLLRSEMTESRGSGHVREIFEASGLGTVPGVMRATFTAGRDHALVSFATMVAPSPDWFTGASGVRLFVDGAWVDSLEFVLLAWDSGTDSGRGYRSRNADTQPRESVRLLATPHVLDASGLRPLGRAVLTRMR